MTPSLKGKLRLISYPISPLFCPDQKGITPKLSEEPILLTVAGIEPRKGWDTLVKAVSLIPRKMRVIAKGAIRDEAYMHRLKIMVKNLNVENKITFVTDSIDYDDLASYYKSATLFVFPTKDDCLGVVILEALHCEVPVIATSVGGIPDMIENGANGILIQANDPHELANAISTLLDNEALRQKLAKNAKRVLHDRYYKNRVTLEEALVQSIESWLLTTNKKQGINANLKMITLKDY